ncbi:MAG: GntR family transcriptional regulator [Alphaproteobacteria bacterium]
MPVSKLIKGEEISDRKIAHEETYSTLYYAIITGGFEPGKVLTIRGLAEQMGCSPTPIREAIRRLVALGALEMRRTGRISVAPISEEKFHEIWTARTMLEPEIAARAMVNADKILIKKLERLDNEIAEAMEKGDPDKYTLKNWEFHFTLYRAANCPILLRLIESVWLQFGPFMRMVTGRLGTSLLVDQHEMAIESLKKKDEAALREAIRLDIQDGMQRIGSDFQRRI